MDLWSCVYAKLYQYNLLFRDIIESGFHKILPNKKKSNKRGVLRAQTNETNGIPSWPEFVDHVLSVAPYKAVSVTTLLHSILQLSIVQSLHWKDYTSQCSPCLTNFTYLVHLEREGEQEWVIKRTGLADKGVKLHRRNPNEGGRGKPVMEDYLSQLNCRQVC